MTQNKPKGIKGLDEYKNLVNQKTSALSNLNQANQTAMKYADNTALAQGYATQGARLQNTSNLQNAYLNQVGGINQNFQNQLGNLKNTVSANEKVNALNNISSAIQGGTLNQAYLDKIINDAKNSGLMQENDLDSLISQGQVELDSKISTEKEALLKNAIENGLSTTEAQNIVNNYDGNYNNALLQIYQAVETPTSNGVANESTGNNVYASNNGSKYETNVSKINASWGKTFDLKIGSKTFTMRMGDKVSDINLNPDTINIGEIVTYKGKNGTYLVTKDNKGDIRYVGTKDVSPHAKLENVYKSWGNSTSKAVTSNKELYDLFYNPSK